MIVYLHGFASSGASYKAGRFKELLAPIPVLSPTYGHDPGQAVPFLEDFIRTRMDGAGDDPLLLIGSSLGGYYAQYLARRTESKAVLINPALDPMGALKQRLGENRNYQDGESFVLTEAQVSALERYDVPAPCRDPIPTLVLLDLGDKVIDPALAMARYRNCGKLVVFDGGNHGFAHIDDAVPAILELYREKAEGD